MADVGEVLAGRYELVDPLASGAAGTVWRAWDHREREYVAVKVLRQVDAASLVRFVREQAVRVEHPHVLVPRGWAGDDDRVILVMDLVRGGSLAQLVGDHGALPVTWVVTLLGQGLQALAAVHSAGVIHRDVKPANVLLEATGASRPHLRLADFGVAVPEGEPRLTRFGHVVGTPGYLAPEALEDDGDPHPALDVYAWGVCGVELLTGVAPGRAGLLPPIPAGGLGDLLRRMTALDPAARPSATEALAVLQGLEPASAAGGGSGQVEVFDQVPELPAGWGADGPAARSDVAAEAVTGPVPEPGAGVEPRRSATVVDRATATVVDRPTATQVDRPTATLGPDDPTVGGRRLGLPVALMAAGASLLGIAAVLLLR